MAYQLEQLPDEPIVICTISQNYDMATDAPLFAQEIEVLASSRSEPFYLVIIEAGYTPGFDDVIVGANVATRGEHPVFRNPGLREVLYVTSNKVTQLALKGLNSPIFGNTRVKVFGTQEEALAYARSQYSILSVYFTSWRLTPA